MTQTDLFAILPIIVLAVWAMALLLIDLSIPAGRKGITTLLSALGMAVSLGLTLAQSGQSVSAFNGMLTVDGFSTFLNVLFLGSGIAGVALAYDYLNRMNLQRGEYYVLLMFSVTGMMLMAQAADLIVVFLALEMVSIPLYILSGFARPRPESEESALKYFLLGSFSSAFVLYGVAMTFGATAHTGLQGILGALQTGTANLPLFLFGAGLMLVGFGFKVAAVPFHMWTPDVYQGAPSPVTGFMSVGAKAAGFAALLRVFMIAFQGQADAIAPVIWALAALTMIVGNVLAISQQNVKRMLAYSSIAQAGYILVALVAYGNGQVASDAVASALFYLVTYGLTSIAAWSVVVALEGREGRGLQMNDYAGLAKRYPLLSAVMLIAMLSFAGIPPTLGFWGKFYLFRTAIEAGNIGLAIIGLLTSIISAYYYLRIVVLMYMRDGQPEARRETWLNLAGAVAAIAILVLSIFPGLLFSWAINAGLGQALQTLGN